MGIKFTLDDESISTDVAETIERMPDVSEHFNPSEDTASAPATVQDSEAEFDSAGIAWNAEAHSASKSKNAKGEWRKRRKSRAITGVVQTQATQANTDPNKPLPLTPDQINACKLNGRMYANAEFMIFQSIFDREEWRPETDEHAQMVHAWEEAAIAMRWYNTHPLALPVIATVTYASPRITNPGKKTMSRMQRVRVWFEAQVAARRERQAKKHQRLNPNGPRTIVDEKS